MCHWLGQIVNLCNSTQIVCPFNVFYSNKSNSHTMQWCGLKTPCPQMSSLTITLLGVFCLPILPVNRDIFRQKKQPRYVSKKSNKQVLKYQLREPFKIAWSALRDLLERNLLAGRRAYLSFFDFLQGLLTAGTHNRPDQWITNTGIRCGRNCFTVTKDVTRQGRWKKQCLYMNVTSESKPRAEFLRYKMWLSGAPLQCTVCCVFSFCKFNNYPVIWFVNKNYCDSRCILTAGKK